MTVAQTASSNRKKISPLALVLTLSAVFFVLFLLITAGVAVYKSPKTGHSSKASFLGSENDVGVIELNGVIMDSKKTLAKLEKFEEDDAIKAVVLRLNSPGGSVAPSQEIYEAVKAYKKPLVVSMSSVAASGAFYIACGAKKVYANAGTITGSIGVIMEFINLKKLYEWARVQRYSIKTGRFKDVGAEYKEMSEDERALLQNMVDDVLLQFKKSVAEGRKLTMEQVTAIADGRILSGSQAKKAHLIDELGTLQDAVNEAAKQANLKGKPNVVYPDRQGRGRWLDLLFDEGGSREESSSSYGGGLIGLASRFLAARGGSEGVDLGTAITGTSPGIYWLWKGAR